MSNNTSGSAKATSIETNDVSPISAGERHGKAWHLFTVWSSPNLEFATVFIGFLAVIAFGLNVWHAILAVVVGNTLAAVTHGVLSTWGPKHGLPQMVLSRSAFGKWGNLLPAGMSTLVAGIGWFAVNSTSGAFALQALTGLQIEVSLAIVVVAQVGIAFVGHNLIQKFERYAFYYLVVVFGIASVIVLSQGNYVVPADKSAFNLIGFTLTAAAAYGYTAGWTAFASDYTRYLPANTDSKQLGWAAGLGNWFATTLLMSVGAVAWTVASPDGNPTQNFTNLLHSPVLASLVLFGIAVGSIGANVLNVYSGAMSFLAMGFKLGFKTRRALMVALAGIIGSATAYAAIKGDFVGSFEGFLLVVSYWVAPWIAVVFTDWLVRGRKLDSNLDDNGNWAGPVAFVIAMLVSVVGFCNQLAYTGPLAKAWAVGDITPLVGFALAAGIYALLFKVAVKK
ncbi:MAG: cytosine permease [Actinomycetales bacterium]|nr:cytosine permease [Actinomycetales bacterium]